MLESYLGFIRSRTIVNTRHKRVLQSLDTKVSVTVKGKCNQLYAQGMRPFQLHSEICKHFTEGKQKGNGANEIQKHLKLHGLNISRGQGI